MNEGNDTMTMTRGGLIPREMLQLYTFNSLYSTIPNPTDELPKSNHLTYHDFQCYSLQSLDTQEYSPFDDNSSIPDTCLIRFPTLDSDSTIRSQNSQEFEDTQSDYSSIHEFDEQYVHDISIQERWDFQDNSSIFINEYLGSSTDITIQNCPSTDNTNQRQEDLISLSTVESNFDYLIPQCTPQKIQIDTHKSTKRKSFMNRLFKSNMVMDINIAGKKQRRRSFFRLLKPIV
ncbi:hypothetical protein BC833DRAFT_607342 [Globomyces pollinis-pini]|nr:hypothetical protein BC833DRAFT_607342 [Globomyces pollinis-pini]